MPAPLGPLTQLSNSPPNTNLVDAVVLNAIHNALQGKTDEVIAALDHRGKSINNGVETISSPVWVPAPTRDRVQGIVLPTDGRIVVSMLGQFNMNAASHFSVRLTINDGSGAVPLKIPAAGGGNDYAATSAIGALNFGWFVTGPSGFTLYNNGGADGTAATKGMVIGTGSGGGAECVIDAAAGTYDIEAQYGVDGGVSSIRNRRLRVQAEGF